MREIKFRVWDKKKRHMHYGHFGFRTDGFNAIFKEMQ